MKYVESITVCPSNKTIQIGKWYYGATATVCPCDADKPSVCWYSDNESVAAVNPTTGYIYGVSLGTTRIYAQACDGSGVEGCMTVTVSETVPVESVSLNYGYLSIEKGTSVTLTTFIYPEDATNKSLTWCSSNESVARVVNGVVCGIGRGTARITATTANGKLASCIVAVTENILVTSITVEPSSLEMTVGDSAYLDVTVLPTNANDKSVIWRSDNTSIATVNLQTGLVMAQSSGTTKIYAIANDSRTVYGACTIRVEAMEQVEFMSVYPKKMTLMPGEDKVISLCTNPTIVPNTYIKWTSSDTNIVTVEKGVPDNGIKSNFAWVTGKNKGTATITAMARDGSGKKDSCTVTVDPRERVTVKKDGDFFNVIFADGMVWKSVGRDLSLDENTSGNLGYGYLEWDNLYEWEQRFLDNFQNSYTDDQLAYIYYFDPLGVEDYMVNTQSPIYNNKTMLEKLNFKDSLYNKIFGIIPNKFYFNENGEYDDYQNHIGWDRLEYYSNAEILFGWHRTPFEGDRVFIAAISTAFNLLAGEAQLISDIQNGITLYKYAFYGASIFDFSTSLITSAFSLYEAKLMVWVISLVSAIANATFSQFEIPNDMTVEVYRKVESLERYRTVFMVGGTEVSMNDVIMHC